MGLEGKKKEMLFILGQFLKKTRRRFSLLKVEVSKAEFIDVIMKLSAVGKSKRAVYKNLADLQKQRYLSYDSRKLKLSKKGLTEYNRILSELKTMNSIQDRIKSGKIMFKRKTQTLLK